MKRNCWDTRQKTWTDEKLNWLIESKEKYEDREDILVAFNEHFKTNITLATLRDISTKKKLGLPHAHRAISVARENLETGWVKLRGFTHKQIGDDIRQGNCDKAYIKVSNAQNKSEKYILKQRYLYEKYHNEKLDPMEDLIIFLDNDYTNFSKENLYKMKRRTHALMVNHRLYRNKNTDKILLIKFCEWKEKVILLDKKIKEELL